MTGHGSSHDRSWSCKISGEKLMRAWSVMAQPWSVMGLGKKLLKKLTWSIMGPSMTGHGRRQKYTGKNDMIGHGCRPKMHFFLQLLESISLRLLYLQSIFKQLKSTINYKTSLFKLKLITKPTNELIAR